MTKEKGKREPADALENDLNDPIVDKFEDLMDKFSQIDVDEMITGINDMVAAEKKDR